MLMIARIFRKKQYGHVNEGNLETENVTIMVSSCRKMYYETDITSI